MTSVTRPTIRPATAPSMASAVAPLTGVKASAALAGVDYSRPRPALADFIYPSFGDTKSISFSPYGDVGAVIATDGILIIQPSTGAILNTVPQFPSQWRSRVDYSPTAVGVWQHVGDSYLASFHDVETGMVVPNSRFDPSHNEWKRVDHYLSYDRRSVIGADELPARPANSTTREGRIAEEGASALAAIQLQVDEMEAGGFGGATVSPSGNRVMVDAVYANNPFVRVFDGRGLPLVRVPGSFVGFLPGGDTFMVSKGRGADHAFVIHDGVTGEQLSNLPSPWFDVGPNNTFLFRGESQVAYQSKAGFSEKTPRFRIEVDANGQTIALSDRWVDRSNGPSVNEGIGYAWRFPLSGAAEEAKAESSFESASVGTVGASRVSASRVDSVVAEAQRKYAERARLLDIAGDAAPD